MDIEKLLNLGLPEDDIQALKELGSDLVFIEDHNAELLERLVHLDLAEKDSCFYNGGFYPCVKISDLGKIYLVLSEVKSRSQRKARSRSFRRDIAFLFLGGGVTWLFDHVDAIFAFIRWLCGQS